MNELWLKLPKQEWFAVDDFPAVSLPFFVSAFFFYTKVTKSDKAGKKWPKVTRKAIEVAKSWQRFSKNGRNGQNGESGQKRKVGEGGQRRPKVT